MAPPSKVHPQKRKRKMKKIPQATLSSGQKIPLVGLGTACHPIPSSETLTSTFLAAMEVGYTHFDTAALYQTEESLGTAVAEALRRGLVKRREDLFITSKLWCTDAQSELVLPALQTTLRNLGLEYIDLYLIHWPVRIKGECKPIFKKEDIMPMDFKAVWEAMEECHKLGLTKSIGVSNFSSKKLLDLLAIAKIPPSVNQVEMNVCWQQRKLKEVCNEKGIHITAWSPLGANGTPWGSFNVMKSPILKEIADAKGKSVAQVALRWVHEQGVSVVAKSCNRERMEQNLDIFNWELTEEELYKISEIPQCRGCPGDNFVSPQGPYRTLEELWDGEQ